MAGCTKGCKEEFKCSNFSLTHPDPKLFVTSQWTAKCGCMNVFYLLYRWAVAMGLIAMLILLILDNLEEDPTLDGWYRYVTNWSALVLTLDSIIQFVLAAYGYSLYRKIGVWDKVFTYMPWYLKLEWLITNIATCAGFVVTALFWTTLVPTLEFETVPIPMLFFHGINAAYLFLNLLITAMPVRIYHVFHSWIYFIVYLGFDAIFQLVLEEPAVYPVINWQGEIGLQTILAVVVVAILAPLGVWLIYYMDYRIRLLIFGCMRTEEKEDRVPAVMDTQEKGTENMGFQGGDDHFNRPPMSNTNLDRRGAGMTSGSGEHMGFQGGNDHFNRPPMPNTNFDRSGAGMSSGSGVNQPLKINYGTNDGKFQSMGNAGMTDPYTSTNNGITVNTNTLDQKPTDTLPLSSNPGYPDGKTQPGDMTTVGDNGYISKIYVN